MSQQQVLGHHKLLPFLSRQAWSVLVEQNSVTSMTLNRRRFLEISEGTSFKSNRPSRWSRTSFSSSMALMALTIPRVRLIASAMVLFLPAIHQTFSRLVEKSKDQPAYHFCLHSPKSVPAVCDRCTQSSLHWTFWMSPLTSRIFLRGLFVWMLRRFWTWSKTCRDL